MNASHVSPNVFARELNIRHGSGITPGMLLRAIALGKVPARLNDKGTRGQLDLADIEVAAEALGLTKIPNAA
jgi:hypothetical protein